MTPRGSPPWSGRGSGLPRWARKRASALGAGLRVVVPGGTVLRILQVLGADRVLDVYPSLDAALAEEPRAS